MEELEDWKDFGIWGRAEMLLGRFWYNPRNFVHVEQAVDAAKIFPTPCPRPGFRHSLDLGNFAWVENRPEMPESSRFGPGSYFLFL